VPAFLIGYVLGILTGPLAVYGVAFYFSSRDKRTDRPRPS